MRITFGLIGANFVMFTLQLMFWDLFMKIFALTPTMALGGAWWQFITYMFLHGGPMHIILNMFMLFIFGEVMEQALGEVRYLTLYLVSGLGSAMTYILLMGVTTDSMIGASGAVFGILAAYGLMFPKNKIWVPIPFIVPLPAFTVVILLAVLEFALGFLGLEPGIANFGHFGGIVTGILITWYWKKTSRPRNLHERRNYEFFWE
jgi:membrane associated rhomboid family serine protease